LEIVDGLAFSIAANAIEVGALPPSVELHAS
jgi:hypothetical protein